MNLYCGFVCSLTAAPRCSSRSGSSKNNTFLLKMWPLPGCQWLAKAVGDKALLLAGQAQLQVLAQWLRCG